STEITDNEEEIAKIDVHDDTERGRDDDEESKNDEESDDEETKEEESFDPIPKTLEDSKDDGNGKEDQGLRISEEERIHEEEEADELYHDVDINQGKGLQVSQDIEDSHMTLTSVHLNGQQESSSVSLQFVTIMLNSTSDVAPKPKASARRKRSGSDTSITPTTAITTLTTTGDVTPRLTAATKGKQPAKAKSPSDPSELARTEAQQLKIFLRRSRHETHISQHGGFSTDERTGSKPGVPNVHSDDSEEEISWNSSDDEETDTQEQD
nr:hypothetical protein [Tanacetum cinerariifolium]